MFVLLKIIRFQRQNEAIKNDFIGNIAHELKTPIATVWAALEAMADVNRSADPDKARNYLKTAREHLSKLDGLADKILDTAAMEHQRLNLRLKLEDLTYMLHNLVLKYQEIYPHKTFRFEGSGKKLFSEIDIFYFEPAVGNIIDNAAKYGGNYIDIQIAAEKKGLSILVSDNGEGIAPAHAQKIFNKFYRVPQGDVHDVKGFGLGLYFSKNIIESHGASLNLSKLKPATFKIFIPDAS